MSVEPTSAEAAVGTKARRYLYWYPLAWRERYGEEFAAVMEAELSRQPASWRRSINIVAHGVLARITYPRRARTVLIWSGAVLLVAAGVATGLAFSRSWAPITISSGGRGGIAAVSMPITTRQVADVAFNFDTGTSVAIKITSVSVEPLQGFPTPSVTHVAFSPHASELANARGWPLTFPRSKSFAAKDLISPVAVIDRTVTLSKSNVIWLGLRAPVGHRAYVVDGLQVHYEFHGVSHVMTIDHTGWPDVICATSHSVSVMPTWCTNESLAAGRLAAFQTTRHAPDTLAPSEALLVSQLALDELPPTNLGSPPLGVVKYWAARLFPPTSTSGIRDVRAVVGGGVSEWRFTVRRTSTSSVRTVCVTKGQVNVGGGVQPITVNRCP